MGLFDAPYPKVIRVQVKSNYGNPLVYPICETAKMFAQLTRNKTLRMSDVEIIKKLGFTVEQVHPEKLFP